MHSYCKKDHHTVLSEILLSEIVSLDTAEVYEKLLIFMLVFVKPPSKDAKVIYMFLRTGPKILSLKMMMKILVNKVYYIFYSVKNDHENGLTMRHRDDKVFVEGSRVILTLPNPKV